VEREGGQKKVAVTRVCSNLTLENRKSLKTRFLFLLAVHPHAEKTRLKARERTKTTNFRYSTNLRN